MAEPFKPVALPGGSIIHKPAGTFTEEGTNRLVNYDEKIQLDYMGKVYRLPPDAIAALYTAIRNQKDLADFLGVKGGIL
jgi:hypothetical protein